jgi:hypothetical protein
MEGHVAGNEIACKAWDRNLPDSSVFLPRFPVISTLLSSACGALLSFAQAMKVFSGYMRIACYLDRPSCEIFTNLRLPEQTFFISAFSGSGV